MSPRAWAAGAFVWSLTHSARPDLLIEAMKETKR